MSVWGLETDEAGDESVPALGHGGRQSLWPCLNTILNARSEISLTSQVDQQNLRRDDELPPCCSSDMMAAAGRWLSFGASLSRHDQRLSCLVFDAH